MVRLRSLAARLVVGQALVILAGTGSLALVALAVAPGIFRTHVREALGTVPPGELDHLDHAFQDTLVLALGAAIAVAAATALAISLLLAARIAAPIRRLAAAADRVARGERGVRVALAGANELRAVSASFNAMATTLEHAEAGRRAFVSDIAHELRTPLTTIDGYLEGHHRRRRRSRPRDLADAARPDRARAPTRRRPRHARTRRRGPDRPPARTGASTTCSGAAPAPPAPPTTRNTCSSRS